VRIDIENRIYFQSELLLKMDKISHCFTTKCGGKSQGKVTGLNLGFRCGDFKDTVTANYRQVAKDMSFPFERITAGRQTHSANIRIMTEDDAGKGVSRESDMQDVDGLVTNVKNLPIVIYYADCVPILLADETAKVIAAVHSGWRGTVSQIATKAAEIMTVKFGSNPDNIKAVIGPSIGPCCFETGKEVAEQFDLDLVKEKQNGKYMVDLWEANRRILLGCNIKPQNIEVLKLCTVCRNDIFYSYRTHKDATGRMGAFIMLK